jgi:serine-type D-Ala-D-Ala carboxypeptidase
MTDGGRQVPVGGSGPERAAALLRGAIEKKVFPAAAAEVGTSESAIWSGAFGRLTFDAGSPAASPDTIFDLASLAKPVATATLAMDLMRAHALELHEPVSTFFAEWRGTDRETVTVRELLEHASGLPARLVDSPPATRREFEHDICGIRLEYEPRSRSVYSDLGFLLLGFLVEARGGKDLSRQFNALWAPFSWDSGASEWLGYGIPEGAAFRTAPTTPLDSDLRRGRVLAGEVHDNYAAALGGVAGHTGLFGTAAAVGRFARAMLKGARGDAAMTGPFSPDVVARATTKTTVPGSSRALGWDTMLPTSSCGSRMSPAAFGHVGFTGTSLWIDPIRDRYFVLLTNRVFGSGPPDEMRTVRRAFHDTLATIDG